VQGQGREQGRRGRGEREGEKVQRAAAARSGAGRLLVGPGGPISLGLFFVFFFFSNFEIPIQIIIKFIIIKPKLFVNNILFLGLIFIILFM
jgi:hypothetical protein